jgi:hypothetical protein
MPGNTNGLNKDMGKTSGGNFKGVDFLARRNMTWTSGAPKGDSLKRMGVESKNAPKTMGSTVLGGTALAGGGVMAQGAMESMGVVMPFEGGTPDIPNYKEQILSLKKKYKLSMKAPLTPTINAITGMLFMKLLISGIANAQNNHLLV